MLSNATTRSAQRRFEKDQRIAKWQNWAHKVLFTKRLVKAISIGLFAYITMITGQVAGWIAWPLIIWSLAKISQAVDQYMEWRWAPWQR